MVLVLLPNTIGAYPLPLSTGSPQGCMLIPLLTHTRSHTPPSNSGITLADDTPVVGLIWGEDESAHRDEVQKLSGWCTTCRYIKRNLIPDLRKCRAAPPPPIFITGNCVESRAGEKNVFTMVSWFVLTQFKKLILLPGIAIFYLLIFPMIYLNIFCL